MFGELLYRAHRAIQRAAEPIRYARAKWALRRVMKPLNRQIETARRTHKPVKHLLSARTALIVHALSHPQAGN